MALTTTCIGAYPKPDYLPIKDWFQVYHDTEDYVDEVVRGFARTAGADALFDRATAEAVADQVACGIDIPTDGELRRENYIHYQCRFFAGFDFENLEHRVMRNGAYATVLPAIRGPIHRGESPVLARDWQVAQAATDRPVKITLPGPMTISDTIADCFYDDPQRLARDLAEALNSEILALAEAGCRYIQIDEPVLARKPEAALDYGIETLERCWQGVPEGVTRVVHVCCGYPDRLDHPNYPKADPGAYQQLAGGAGRRRGPALDRGQPPSQRPVAVREIREDETDRRFHRDRLQPVGRASTRSRPGCAWSSRRCPRGT